MSFITSHKDNKEAMSCVSFDYMMGFGYLIGAWLINKSKLKALELLKSDKNNKNFLEAKIISADFYIKYILPRVEMHFKAVRNGSEIISNTSELHL